MEFKFDKKEKPNIDFKFKNPFSNLKAPKKTLIAICIIVPLIFYFVSLPAINLHSVQFWIFMFMTIGLITMLLGPVFKFFKNGAKLLILMALAFGILSISSLEFFHAKRYAGIIQKNEGDFVKDVSEIPYDKIPTVDRDTADRLGSRKMGELIELVSQFNIDDSYTQINYKGLPVRVTPLEYNGLLKWLTNHKEGIPNYLLVNMIDGAAKLEKSSANIKYSKSDLFFRDARRAMRLKFPTKIMGELNFEIDDNGTAFWICPTYENKISWFGAMDVKGAILLNALTGEANYYDIENVPTWVDRVYSAEDVIEQLNWNGKYQSGYWNSRFAQKGVLKTTDGYNYLAIDDDVFLYTGITSVAEDQSNVGFVLVNLRTKETTFYRMSSAEEFSAMSSAQGEVQEKNYVATFPILLNINEKPTYFLSLKDNAGLIKMYAFIDAQNYQNVSTGSTVKAAYRAHLGEGYVEAPEEIKKEDLIEEKGKIEDIKEVVIDGNTHYYFSLEGKENIYLTSIKLSEKLPFIKKGDSISFTCTKLSNNSFKLVEIK